MRLAPLLAASLLASLPAAALAQGMDLPGAPPPAPAAAPAAPPESAPPAVAPATPEPPSVAPAPVAAATPPPKVKSGPYFGFSFGSGKGTMTAGSSSIDIDQALSVSGSSPTTMNLQLRSGFGNGDFLFGAQLNWTRTWVDVSGVSAGFDFMAVDLVATWWDQQMGLYARAGIGPSTVSSFVGDATSESVSGVEMMLGIGATMGGLGVGIDLFRQSYDRNKAGFDTVTYTIVALSLDLY